MTVRRFYSVAVCGCLITALSLASYSNAAEKTVATLTDDTFIGFDSNATPPPEETVQGAEADITVREGTSETSLTAKSLFKFDLLEAIDPTLPYFYEVHTGTDGTSSATLTLFSITDAPLQSIMDETTLTWNEAATNAPNAVTARDNFDDAGNAIGTFGAPGTANSPILVPLTGSDIQTYGAGLGSTLFGVTSNNNSTMNFTSKEAAAGVNQARLFTFDVIDSNGTGGGAINTAATWSDNQVPSVGNLYRVVSGDTVTADGAGGGFAGEGLIAISGATLDFTASATEQKFVQVQAGATLTQNSSGDFFLGNVSDPGSFAMEGTAIFNPSSGADVGLDMNMTGAGTVTVNSNGSGSNLFPSFASNFLGTLIFAGSGDEVIYTEANSGIGGRLEMNSTGLNQLVLDADRTGGGTTAFNQPGSIDHRSTVDRLAGTAVLEANAAVSVDLTKTYDGNERRLFLGDSMEGSAAVTVNGTASDPTSGSVSFNEFEVENTDEPGDGLLQAGYSGTVTANNFVNVEIRREFLDGKFVINQNAVLDIGFRDFNTSNISHRMGDIEVASGGTLNVGYEEDDAEHATAELIMSNDGAEGGDLTMASGSKLQIQVSGTGATDFDRIIVEGSADLAAEIVVITNPEIPGGTNHMTGDPTDAPYVPTLGDTFDIIVAAPGNSADFNNDTNIDNLDLTEWEAAYSLTDGADADGDGDSDGLDFLAWQSQRGLAPPAGGMIIDNGITFVVDDSETGLTFEGTGLEFQLNVSSTLVQLEVVAVPAIASVPEPATCALVGFGLVTLVARRGRRR